MGVSLHDSLSRLIPLNSQTPPHFGGGFSRVTAHSFSSPPWWGCVDLRLAHAPHPRGGPSAIARANQPAPPPWGWVKRIPSAPQRGGFSCYRSCPPSWESVPTKISPFRWESVTLAQLPSPTSVGVPRLRLTIPANVGVRHPASASAPHRRGGFSDRSRLSHFVGVRLYYLSKPMYPLSSKEIVSATFL